MTTTGSTEARRELLSRYDFALDPFQGDALDALDAGKSVLVAAPTGSGKTVIAEYAIELALAAGGKAFYTSPIKALSNQKFGDLVRQHGAERVGLLTGDNSINGDAPIVVMTTEVLRNMIYAASPTLRNLRFVILDEVHYLQDAYRGPVWEEVIIHAQPGVRLVCLSATVSNADELSEWLTTVRGPTEAVIEERRPVELSNLYLVGDKATQELRLLPTLVRGRPNPRAAELDALAARTLRVRGRPRQRLFTPRRVEVIERLAGDELLPAIYFIFSRAACDDAVRACIGAGLRLTTRDEARRIRGIVTEHVSALSDVELGVLGYDEWLHALESGIGAHHAGMVPPFKEAVEACFAEGLIKAVFATETLALGINMPARTVVIEKLTKFGGERHEFLTPGAYTQLTGRAGRRGIDTVGYAVVLWSPFVPFDQIASLATSRSFRLTSAFRPTYNMAANLVQRYRADEAHHLLNLSFAQYQADRSVVRLEARLEQRKAEADDLDAAATCDRGSVAEYRRLFEEARRARQRLSPRHAAGSTLQRARPGTVLNVQTPKVSGRVAVLTLATRHNSPRLRVVTSKAKVVTLGLDDFEAPPEVLDQLELPTPYAPHNRGFQRRVAEALGRVRVRRSRRARIDDPEVQAAEAALGAHPVALCPERDHHLQASAQLERARKDVARLERSVKGYTASLARRFDRVLRVLEAWEHLDGWALTERGRVLVRIYHECDLLVSEALVTGILDGLDPATLAGLVSCFTYERRVSTPPPAPWFPSAQARERAAQLSELARNLNLDEDAAGLPFTRLPDPGFVGLAYGWVAGHDLDVLLEDEEVSGGDFVRNIKQLIDLLRQLGEVAPSRATRQAARQAADEAFRGVVAASSAVGTTDEPVDEHGLGEGDQ